MSAKQIPAEEGGPGWWLPEKPRNDRILNYRLEPAYERHAFDWYVEDRSCVEKLFDAVSFDGLIHDPACGGGNIPRVAISRGLAATGSDLVNRGYNDAPSVDFLADLTPRINICSNPPYVLAERFVQHALRVTEQKVAVLVRLAFLEGQKRQRRLFVPHPPTRVLVFATRPSMPPGGLGIKAVGGKIAYCWMIWDRNYAGEPQLGWLP